MQNAAFDVIGVFGFGKDFKATMDLHGEGAQACKCLARGGMMLSISTARGLMHELAQIVHIAL